MGAAEVIDRMKEALGVDKDAELASVLKRGRNYVYTLRQRNTIPYEDCTDVALKTGASLDWLILGALPAAAVEPSSSAGLDPRIARLVSFFTKWQQTHVPDEIAWLEQHIRRTVPEYADWYAARVEGSNNDD